MIENFLEDWLALFNSALGEVFAHTGGALGEGAAGTLTEPMPYVAGIAAEQEQGRCRGEVRNINRDL